VRLLGILTEETALDRLFAEKRATPQSIAAVTMQIAMAQGRLRAAHLRYHLAMIEKPLPASTGAPCLFRAHFRPEDRYLMSATIPSTIRATTRTPINPIPQPIPCMPFIMRPPLRRRILTPMPAAGT
jgi:hypothetical protein